MGPTASIAATWLGGILLAGVWTLIAPTGCINGQLTPGAEVAILAGDAAACAVLVPLTGLAAGVSAAACAGEEAILKVALDRVTAVAVDGGTGARLLAAARLEVDGGMVTTHAAVFRMASSGRRIHCGYVAGVDPMAVNAAMTGAQ